MDHLAKNIGEESLFNRTGGAPSLAIGMASIFSNTFGKAFGEGMLSVWYHFVIMFEAVFILTTLDAGTRVCRFMLQDVLGGFYKPLGRTSWYPSVILSSFIVVAAWGYFLYNGVIDPNGGVNILWPLFGISNQILATIALCLATVMIVKSKKPQYFWVTALPLICLAINVLSAVWQKLFSDNIRIGLLSGVRDLKGKLHSGFFAPEKIETINQMILNQYVVAILAGLFAILLLAVVFDMVRILIKEFFPFIGADQYQKYLHHFQENSHRDSKPLTKKQFFARREQEKWSKINRCC